jgi:hypothetical protein
MTTLVKANTVTVAQLWRSLSYLARRGDPELLDMTRVRSHSYTSLRDVVAGSLPAPASSAKQWSRSSSSSRHLSSHPSLPAMRPVHMRNPLLEKAARAYLATATATAHAHPDPHPNSTLSSSFSSFLRIVRFPFLTTHRGFSNLFNSFSWFKQLTIKA